MKKLLLLFFLLCNLAIINAQGLSRIQFIHNSPDAALDSVDVWLTTLGVSSLLFNDLPFRQAEAFIVAPAGIPLQVGFAPANSSSVNDTLGNFNITLAAGQTYYAIINGTPSPGYSPQEPLTLSLYDKGREVANNGGQTDIIFHNGATDTGPLDIFNPGQEILWSTVTFGRYAHYEELSPTNQPIQLRSSETMRPLSEFDLPLGTLNLSDSAGILIASVSPPKIDNYSTSGFPE